MVFLFVSYLYWCHGTSSNVDEQPTTHESVVESKDDIPVGTSKDTDESNDITIEKLGLSKKDLCIFF